VTTLITMPANPEESESGSEYEDEEPVIKSSRKRGKGSRNLVITWAL